MRPVFNTKCTMCDEPIADKDDVSVLIMGKATTRDKFACDYEGGPIWDEPRQLPEGKVRVNNTGGKGGREIMCNVCASKLWWLIWDEAIANKERQKEKT